jgi:hypothetical protein
MHLLILRFRHHGPGTPIKRGRGGRYGPGGVWGGRPTSLKEPARLRHQPGACPLFIYLSIYLSIYLYLHAFSHRSGERKGP